MHFVSVLAVICVTILAFAVMASTFAEYGARMVWALRGETVKTSASVHLLYFQLEPSRKMASKIMRQEEFRTLPLAA
jgi:heme/copper-type cytochrome/quinol oxidase subunit 4